MRQPQIRLLAGANEGGRDWSPAVQPDGESLVHIVGGEEDLPRVAPVVCALSETAAFHQRVLAVAADGAEVALARLGVEATVEELPADGMLDALLSELDRGWAVVCIHGEGEAALAGSVAAARHSLPLVRIGRASAPTPMSRAVARLADLILVPDERERDALASARVPAERIHVVGSPLVGAVRARLREAAALEAWRAHGLQPGRYTLAVLTRAGTRFPAPGDAPPDLVILAGDARWAGAPAGAIRDPGFVERLSLQRAAGLIITDSERVLEEAETLGVACRRPAAGASMPTGPTPIPLWGGHAGRRIAEVVVTNFARVRLA